MLITEFVLLHVGYIVYVRGEKTEAAWLSLINETQTLMVLHNGYSTVRESFINITMSLCLKKSQITQ